MKQEPFRLRTKIRGYLPWFLIDLGLASKGKDCAVADGYHEWYNIDGKTSGCYHCEVVKEGKLWSKNNNKVNLPTYKNDHYELDDAEIRQQESPNTFKIPSKELRENLSIGSIVKLIFNMQSTTNRNEIETERMWVIITDKQNDLYIGSLDNDPYGDVYLKSGQTIYFQAKHIIDIAE